MNAEIPHYIDAGPSKSLPVILIHAFPLTHAQWTVQIEALSAKYRVIAYDIRGHGESAVGEGQYTIEFFVDDLMALLDHLRIERAVLCGMSMGGYIALRAVQRHPQRFGGLALCDTRSASDSDAAKLKRFASLKNLKEKGVTDFADAFVKSALAPETLAKKPEVVAFVKSLITKNAQLGISGAILAMACRTDTTAALSDMKIPTLILVGEKDQITPPTVAAALQDKIPHAKWYVIPSAGHLSNLENPQEFNRRLLTFLYEM